MSNKKEFTENEALEMMYNNTGNAFKSVAKFVEDYEMDKQEIIDYLIEIAEQHHAQAIVIKLRDDINKM